MHQRNISCDLIATFCSKNICLAKDRMQFLYCIVFESCCNPGKQQLIGLLVINFFIKKSKTFVAILELQSWKITTYWSSCHKFFYKKSKTFVANHAPLKSKISSLCIDETSLLKICLPRTRMLKFVFLEHVG